MKDRLSNFKKKPFVRNVFIMATSTAAAQAVTLALSPIITRLYGPEAFGLLGTFTAIAAIISPIAALTYPIAIVLPKSENDAKGLVRLSLYITSAIALLVAIILILLNRPIVRLFKLEDIALFLYLIPLVILFSGLIQVTEQWLIRTKQFKITARVTFLQSVILNGSKIGIGLLYPAAMVLITLTVLGQLLKAIMMNLWSNSFIYTKKKIEENGHQISIRYLSKKYIDFPLYRSPQVLLNAVSQGLPILMLTTLFGPASAGFYSLGKTVLSAPSQLIGKSVGDVFYPRISEAAKRGENITRLLIKATLLLAVVGFIPFGIIVVFGPQIFSFVFGADWIIAGEYARWMALWIFVSFMNRPAVSVIQVIGLQGKFLLYEIVSTVLRFGSLYFGFSIFKSDIAAVTIFSLVSVLLNLFLIIFTVWKSNSNHRKLDLREDYN
ncbi:oligosaccharide flippase family protein [Allobacillus sp. SKP2-8]|uniref:lipopolysaccharide biosynthesis protein n=1 Tax=unclassified Allobacillus TaxID=2628859 RepID=UPI001181EB14|nr:oligosaccharide flippase family protein [Allobacillus sp. SKP2-8]TSJ67380.1 oligosaccharide flippase family protein [Allobacillus sp. SKP2-8]